MDNSDSVGYIEGYTPGVAGRMIELHGVFYSTHWGVGAEFETLMGSEICEFLRSYDPAKDLLVTAQIGKRAVGCIAILGEPERRLARLRWFLLDPAYHGRGIGTTLLNRSLEFAARRYERCYLWTVTGLPESMHLYEKYGFIPTETEDDARYGAELRSVKMELVLSAFSGAHGRKR